MSQFIFIYQYRFDMENKYSGRGAHGHFLLKLIMWFIVLMAVGTIACIVLGTLRIAVQAVVITGAVLMFIILIGIIAWNSIRNRIRRDEND